MSRARVQLFHGPGRPFSGAEVPLPERLAEGEVLVAITLATICGSDLHTTSGRRSAPTPCVLGHEAVGVVMASARPGLEPGCRVTWSIADSCGECAPCSRWSLPQKCDHLFKYGHASLEDGSGLNGCYATHIVIRPGTALFEVPDALTDAMAAPANCALATVMCALEHLPAPCESALVQGAGLLGLYACAVLRARGVTRVFCSDAEPERLDLLPAFGAIPLAATPGAWPANAERIRSECPQGVDLVVELAGTAAVVPEGMEILRPGGLYIWGGMVHPQTAVSLTGEAVVRKCATIRGVHNYAPRHLKAGLRFLAEQREHLPFERLVSPPFPLEQLDEAFALTATRRWLRVAVTPLPSGASA